MWIAKIRFGSQGTLIGSKASEFGVDLFGFPLAYFYDKKWVYVQVAGTIIGEEQAKKGFVRALKKEKRVRNLEINRDFIIGEIKEPLFSRILYDKEIIHIAPAYMSSKGYEIITIGSFDKKPLLKAIKLIDKNYQNSELISIHQKRIKSISVMKLRPEMTDKQKKAIELAVKYGYYSSPRKIDVKRLSEKAGLSFSTYQVHLRKAEAKLMPFMLE